MDSHFASGARAEPSELMEMAQRTLANPIVQAILASAEGYVMVLNQHRQILAANEELLQSLGLQADHPLLGHRPGEAMDCVHVSEGPSGCGTSQACSQCGAVLAILMAQTENHAAESECWLSFRRNGRLEACEFRVRATPLPLGDDLLVVLVLVDISASKRRDVLESLFHHDMSNTLQGLTNWSEIIQAKAGDPQLIGRKILSLSLRLKQQLDCHRFLMEAEAGTFAVNMAAVNLRDLFSQLDSIFASRVEVQHWNLVMPSPPVGWTVPSDPKLLLRILENMILNALEATSPGETVTVWAAQEGGQTLFHVRNPGLLPEAVALRIFQRSFSTKGAKGRGLGTYSMKLFGETYLGGKVSFTSSEAEGITFSLALPNHFALPDHFALPGEGLRPEPPRH